MAGRARNEHWHHGGQWPPCSSLLGKAVAPIEHNRQQRAHALDLVDGSARQRAVAIILGKCDKKIGPRWLTSEAKVRWKVVTGRDRRTAYRHREFALLEIRAVDRTQVILKPLNRLGVGISPIVKFEFLLHASNAADK